VLPPNSIFLPIAEWGVASTPATYHTNVCRFSGLVLDSTDIAWFLDGDNKVIHQVQVALSSLTYVASYRTCPRSPSAFRLTALFTLPPPSPAPPQNTLVSPHLISRSACSQFRPPSQQARAR
jgi:hypothetical protein